MRCKAFSGGLAQSETIRAALAQYLGTQDVQTHPLSQYNGAIGAAVLGTLLIRSITRPVRKVKR